MDDKVRALWRKLESADRGQVPKNASVLETLLTEDEQATLRYMAGHKHQENIGTSYPQIPSRVMTESEKARFEFCSKSADRAPNELAGFRQDLGWHTTSTRQKSVFISSKHGIYGQLATAMSSGEAAPELSSSLFGAFLAVQSPPNGDRLAQADQSTKRPDFPELRVDDSESDLIDGSGQASEDYA